MWLWTKALTRHRATCESIRTPARSPATCQEEELRKRERVVDAMARDLEQREDALQMQVEGM